MNTTYETIKISTQEEFITIVSLNRAEVKNAMNTKMVLELTDFFKNISLKNDTTRCLILTGGQVGSFCSGADLKERINMASDEWLRHYEKRQALVKAMANNTLPIIAAIGGPAFGGGCEIALACDFIYAADNAIFALSEVRLGIMPGAGGTQYLPRAIGIRRAKELIYTGNTFSAQDAYEWGLVNKLCCPNELFSETLVTAKIIAANAPISILKAKNAIEKGSGVSLLQGLDIEADEYKSTVVTNDRLEGIAAFNERRKAYFKGN